MKHSPLLTAVTLSVSVFVCNAPAQSSDYYIRPYTNSGPAGTIDGLQLNGPFSGSQGFSNAAVTNRANVNLTDGSLKAYAAINNTTGFSMAMAEYSDTLHLRSATANTFTFDFSYDGQITADAKSVPEGSIYQLGFIADFAVFRPGEADWNTWWDRANAGEAMFYDSNSIIINDSLEDVDESVGDGFSFSTELAPGMESFEFFARIQTYVNGNTPQTAVMDFENTALFGFSADSQVQVFSASGALPGTTQIPEASAALLGGLGVLALLRRRRG